MCCGDRLLVLAVVNLAIIFFQCELSTRLTRDANPMLMHCWVSVADAEPTVIQHWVSVSCLRGGGGGGKFKIPLGQLLVLAGMDQGTEQDKRLLPMQRQTTVTACFSYKHLRLFVVEGQYCPHKWLVLTATICNLACTYVDEIIVCITLSNQHWEFLIVHV